MLKSTMITVAATVGLAVSASLAAGGKECGDEKTTHRATYPTSTIADYVLGCMISNGQSPEILQKCSCSMDYIAAAIPYGEY